MNKNKIKQQLQKCRTYHMYHKIDKKHITVHATVL